MNYKVGFIGTGNMGSALLDAVSKTTKDIAVSDFSYEKAQALSEKYGVVHTDNKEIAANAKYIFLGVKPQVISELLAEISPIIKKRKDNFVIVTMAAGTSIEDILNSIGKSVPVIRIMPNTPVSVGAGIILYCANPLVDSVTEFTDIMKNAGTLDEIPEHLIDAASCVTGCSPAWIYMFIESLADGAVLCGLPRDKAISYVCDALIGSATLVKKSKKHPDQLKDEVCSPGGTTIEGVKALEKGAFRGICMDAVLKAFEKTNNLKK